MRRQLVEEIMPYTDLFLYDLKLMDSEKHRKWTGVGNDLILGNLFYISGSGKEFHVRIPLIGGVNCDVENISQTITFLKALPHKPAMVGLLPYHNSAMKKYEKLGRDYNENGMKEPSKEKIDQILTFFKENGFNTRIGG